MENGGNRRFAGNSRGILAGVNLAVPCLKGVSGLMHQPCVAKTERDFPSH